MKGIVWLASYPKSGNTWFRIFLSNLLKDGAEPVDINELDTTGFGSRAVFERGLGWESSELAPAELAAARIPVQEWMAQEDDLAFKVHDAFCNPRTGEALFSVAATRAVLYFIRNPLDVAISYSHHSAVDVDGTIALMAKKDAVLAPSHNRLDVQLPQPMGTWSFHVRSWTEAPKLPVHVVRYEDMLAHPVETFSAACAFAGFPGGRDRVERAVKRSSFESLRAQEEAKGFREAPGGRRFFRQGKAGGWREVLSPAQVERILADHGEVMRKFGYVDAGGSPL